MALIQRCQEGPRLHVFRNIVRTDADPIGRRAREEETTGGIEHGVNECAGVFRLTGPASISGQFSEHCKQRNAINVLLGRFEEQLVVAVVHAEVETARSPAIDGVIHDPVTQARGSFKEALRARAMKELGEGKCSPGEVTRRRPQKKEWEKSRPEENTGSIRVIYEVGLANTAVSAGVGLLGMQQGFAENSCPGNIVRPAAQQVGEN